MRAGLGLQQCPAIGRLVLLGHPELFWIWALALIAFQQCKVGMKTRGLVPAPWEHHMRKGDLSDPK